MQKGHNIGFAFQKLLHSGVLRHDLTELPGPGQLQFYALVSVSVCLSVSLCANEVSQLPEPGASMLGYCGMISLSFQV